jgi:hypothetical protein
MSEKDINNDVSNFVAVHPYARPIDKLDGGFFQELRKVCRTNSTIEGVSSFGERLIIVLREYGFADGWIAGLLGFETDRAFFNWTGIISLEVPEHLRTAPSEYVCDLPRVGHVTIRATDASQKEWEGFINDESVAKATAIAKIARAVEEIAKDRLNKMP